jgi:uncharacterized protein (TIGR02145 family)
MQKLKLLSLKTTGKIWILNLILVGFIILFTISCKTVNEPIFGGTIKDIDGNVYNTVTIGTQTWLIENLKTTHFNDSTSIPLARDSASWASLVTPGYCWYGNDSTTNNNRGALYNWYTVDTGKLAPKGWHVPSDDEWLTLENNVTQFYNNSGSLAKILASTTNWSKSTYSSAVGNNLSKNNASGFSAIPGGNRLNNKFLFNKIDSVAIWWSSTQTDSVKTAWSLSIRNDISTVERAGLLKKCGLSVRCIKNSD